LAVSGFSVSSASAYRASPGKGFGDLLTSMLQFRCENDLACGIIDQCQPSRLAARINLDPQRLKDWLLDHSFEDDRKWVPLQHSRFATGEQETRSARMHRV
jgi:hypothetical protein